MTTTDESPVRIVGAGGTMLKLLDEAVCMRRQRSGSDAMLSGEDFGTPELRLDELGARLGLKLCCAGPDAGREWNDASAIDAGALLVRLPDGRVAGYHQSWNETTRDRFGSALIHAHLSAFLRGDGEVREPSRAVPGLGRVCDAALRHMGIDPVRFATLALTLASVDAYSDNLPQRVESRHAGSGGWAGHHYQLAAEPAVVLTPKRVTLHMTVPETLAAAMKGRRVTDVVDHPVLADLVVRKAAMRPDGRTLDIDF